MEYTKLGNSQLNVSRICLGCMGFGDPALGQHSWTLDEQRSQEIIAYALQNGINFFDTAMGYQGGSSERYLGRALKRLAAREEVVIATKFMPRSAQEIANGIDGRRHVADMLNASLERLGTDYVDLYIYHMWDYNTPIEQIMQGLNDAVVGGKARAIGISNCFAWQLAQANAIAKANGWAEFVSVQGHYNLIFREEEREMVPLCKQEGIALTPYSALASGRLSKQPGERSTRLEQDAYAKTKYDATAQQDRLIIERVAELAQRRGVSMTEISLAWLLGKVAAPVCGATKKSHIDGAAAATQLRLSTQENEYLEQPYQPHRLVGVMAENH